MLGDISKAEKVYIATGYTDMRKSIDGLAAIVQQNFELNPFQNSLFLFCGRKRDRMKALYLFRCRNKYNYYDILVIPMF
ncbi:IS66 Orf2 like protein [Clostridium ragsdalei P11]|uniref:IS66 Orf2 like protein n=1 Tax=Clostridium ragsdalei P11 TaxID=1353534 RepID=A0A1A6AVT2_9CLOT|nr:IS66 family insertion sequence element accessory protein TnpB [Clostridium ragsdalei]OBR94135.1 IS66 Orf2 like protein [Clostridium ragsdalei P11]